MGIFEQYGIQEVADVTLYSIELDDNDDEIYVPIIYFDTLKISSLEQSSSQAYAKGGLGNPDLIAWDFGKEINVTLQDALYSPASQALCWGGTYGTKKFELYGEFTPYEYAVDSLGKFIYLNENGEAAQYTNGTAKNAKVITDNFNDFEVTQSSSATTGFKWKVNLQLVTLDGTVRYYKEKVSYGYNEDGEEVQNTLRLVYKYNGASHWNLSVNDTDVEKLVFFKNIDNGEKIVTVPVGEFKIVPEKNYFTTPPQEAIYQIKNGLKNVKVLDRMEKCIATQTFVIDADNNLKHFNSFLDKKYSECELVAFVDPKTNAPYEPNTKQFTRKNGQVINGNLRLIKQNEVYFKMTRTVAPAQTSLGHKIVIDAIHFPGTYRFVGETYSRSRATGQDERFQIEIPLCKMSSDTKITLEAGGEPTTFDMNLRVLRPENGEMVRLTQYSVEKQRYGKYTSDSTYVIPTDEVMPTEPDKGSV